MKSGDIPIPTGLPQRPIRKAVPAPYINRPATDIGEMGEFFGALSKIGLKYYQVLKNREAVDQLNRAQNDISQALADYNNWQRQNPYTPDSDLKQYSEFMTSAQNKIEGYLTNGAAQREYQQWFDENRIKWTDRAMENSYRIDTAQKTLDVFVQHNSILEQDISKLDEDGLKELIQKDEIILATAVKNGFLTPTQFEAMRREGQRKLNYDWWEAKLIGAPDDDFAILIADRDIPLSEQERKSIETKRDFYKERADAAMDAIKRREQEKILKLIDENKPDEAMAIIKTGQMAVNLGEDREIWENRILNSIKKPKPNYKKQIELYDKILKAKAEGLGIDEIREEIIKARYDDLILDEQGYAHLESLTRKNYPADTIKALQSASEYGRKNISKWHQFGPDILMQMRNEPRRTQFNNAMIQWLDRQKDITQIKPEDIQRQAVILASLYSGPKRPIEDYEAASELSYIMRRFETSKTNLEIMKKINKMMNAGVPLSRILEADELKKYRMTKEQIRKETEKWLEEERPLLTGEQVPEEYRRLGVREYRPTE